MFAVLVIGVIFAIWFFVSKKKKKIHMSSDELRYVEYFKGMEAEEYDFRLPAKRTEN